VCSTPYDKGRTDVCPTQIEYSKVLISESFQQSGEHNTKVAQQVLPTPETESNGDFSGSNSVNEQEVFSVSVWAPPTTTSYANQLGSATFG
jgi:hypothetical protein